MFTTVYTILHDMVMNVNDIGFIFGYEFECECGIYV